MMSRKHYIAVAAVIREQVDAVRADNSAPRRDRLFALEAVALGLVAIFRADNPNFDRGRFMGACGFGEEG